MQKSVRAFLAVAVQTAIQEPRAALVAIGLGVGGSFDLWLSQVLPTYLSLVASLVGIAVASVLGYKHYIAAKKLKLETKIMHENIADSKENRQLIDKLQIKLDEKAKLIDDLQFTISKIDERKSKSKKKH